MSRAYLHDKRPAEFLREVRREEGQIEVEYRSREEAERQLNPPAPNPPKKRKVASGPTNSQGVRYVETTESDDSSTYDLQLETSICDKDLLVCC